MRLSHHYEPSLTSYTSNTLSFIAFIYYSMPFLGLQIIIYYNIDMHCFQPSSLVFKWLLLLYVIPLPCDSLSLLLFLINTPH